MYIQSSSQASMALLARPKLSGLGEHLGVQVSDQEVIHNTFERGVEVVSLEEFAAGKPVRTVYQIPPHERQNALARAAEILAAEQPYEAIEYNCETTSYYIAGLGAQSPQVKSAAAALLIGGLAWYAYSNSKQ